MEQHERPSNKQNCQIITKWDFRKVKDARGREIRGLWIRNGRYCARLFVSDVEGGSKRAHRIPLDNVHTPVEAKIAMEDLKKERRDECLRPMKQAPFFDEFANVYLSISQGKRESTIER